jgi:hypothetical protein
MFEIVVRPSVSGNTESSCTVSLIQIHDAMTRTDATMDTTLAHLYECERLIESPKLTLPHFYYPGS